MADKIVLWRPMYDQTGHKLLTDAGKDIVIVDSSDAQELVKELQGAKALWVRTPERVTEDILDAAGDLAIVSTSGFGTDNIDIPAATARGILVVNHQGFGRHARGRTFAHADDGGAEADPLGRFIRAGWQCLEPAHGARHIRT